MKNILLIFCLSFLSTSIFAQFQPSSKGLIIKVSDGTDTGRNSELIPKGDGSTTTGKGVQKKADPANNAGFGDPIRALGMTDCIQAAAFLDRPEFGKAGFFLIFSVNDAIGGKQGTHTVEGKVYNGVYRLIRQKTSVEEEIPENMTPYRIQGTFFILGIS